MAYEKLRELLEKWRNEDAKHDEKFSNELMQEINGTALEMQSTVTWHKYPDEVPESDKVLLCFGWGQYQIGKFIWDDEFKKSGSIMDEDFSYYLDGVHYWSYLPDVPNNN